MKKHIGTVRHTYQLFVIFVLFMINIFSGCAVSKNSKSNFRNDAKEKQAIELENDSGNNRSVLGTGKGYRGQVVVNVLMNGGNIVDITIVDSDEDIFVGEAAMEELIDIVIEYNTTDVDVISGATMSSRGFLEAVENAIMNQ